MLAGPWTGQLATLVIVVSLARALESTPTPRFLFPPVISPCVVIRVPLGPVIRVGLRVCCCCVSWTPIRDSLGPLLLILPLALLRRISRKSLLLCQEKRSANLYGKGMRLALSIFSQSKLMS